MKEIDKTKENIGVSGLDQRTKKELFDKFVESGGEVIKEKRRGGFTDFDREKQRRHREKIESQKEKLKSRAAVKPKRKPAGATSKSPNVVPGTKKPGRISLFFERLYIRLRLYIMGITDFSAIYLKPKFLNRFNIEYNPSLMDMQILYLDVFKKNFKKANLILEKLDKTKLLYFELIEKIAGVYDRSTINRIVDEYRKNLDTPQRVMDVREPTMAIFKQLYLLYRYQESLLVAFEKSINLQMQIEKEKSSISSSKKKRARNSIYILFNKLFPALYWLFCHYQGRIIPLTDPLIEKVLSITEDDKLGKRVRPTKPAGISIEKEGGEKSTPEESEEELPENIRKGIELMFKLDLKVLREEYDKQKYFLNAKENDKILMTYLLFQEFDQEYSFILTTNKIKYRVVFSSSGKLDYRTILSDLYNEQRKCVESFREYTAKLASYEKARLDKPINNAQYIEYSKRLTTLEKEKKGIGKNVRMTVKAFMDKVSSEFYKLIEDMGSSQKIVENPQDELVFNTDIEGNKKLNKLKVYEAIDHAYYFASALAYRLGVGCDLSGELEFKEGEEAFSDDKVKGKKDSTDKTDKSVIQELDDML